MKIINKTEIYNVIKDVEILLEKKDKQFKKVKKILKIEENIDKLYIKIKNSIFYGEKVLNNVIECIDTTIKDYIYSGWNIKFIDKNYIVIEKNK